MSSRKRAGNLNQLARLEATCRFLAANVADITGPGFRS
jgi:hypothetical protein